MAIRVLEETGLLPHLNPGVMSWEELQRLKPVAASMGMMLETTSPGCGRSPGPALRLAGQGPRGTAAGAGGRRPPVVPFTTGILVGIGETSSRRADAVPRDPGSAQRYGHSRRSSSRTSGRSRTRRCGADDLELQEYLATIAVDPAGARPEVAVQAPPNLSDATSRSAAPRGRRRLGRGLAAHAGPRQPRAAVAPDRPARRADGRGWLRAARAADCPSGVRAGRPEPWLDPRVSPHVPRSPTRTGWPRGAGPGRAALAGARRGLDVVGPRRPAHRVDTVGRTPTSAATSTPSTATGPTARAHGRRPRRALHGARRRRPRGARRAAARRAGPGRPLRRRVPGAAGRRRGRSRSPVRARRRPAPGRRRRRRHLRRQPEHQLHQRLLHRLPVLRVRPAAHRRRRVHAVPGSRSATAPRRPGRPGRPRSACKAASTRTCPAPPTSTSPAR